MAFWRESLITLAVALLATRGTSQAVNEFDFDVTQLAATALPTSGGSFSVNSPTTIVGQNLQLNGDLVINPGGELVLYRCHMRVIGNVTIQRGGRLTVLDSTLLIPSDFVGQFNLVNYGGLLHTERALIGAGYVNNSLHMLRFLLLRGTWLARHTIGQGLGTALADGPNGWYGNPEHRGGSVFADGLLAGENTDAIHMSGVGDAFLANGTIGIGLRYDASAANQPFTTTMNLDPDLPLDITYGDPTVHEGVTNPLPGSLFRLQLLRHRSPTWQLLATNVTQNGPLQTVNLRDSDNAILGVIAENLVGSPVLGGPWSTHYSELPGLPSSYKPGFHAMPPGCSVQLGNLRFRSDTNAWNRIQAWGIYLEGTGNNFTVTGPSLIAEAMSWGGQLTLQGRGSYDMGIAANVLLNHYGGSISIDNAAIGVHHPSLGVVGLIEANDASHYSITRSRMAPVRLRTTSPGAWIWAQNLIDMHNVTVDAGSGGSITLAQATPSQNNDLQNLSMDTAGAGVPYWNSSGFISSLVADGAPGAPGNTSRELVAGGSGGSLQKSLDLPPETFVTLIANIKLLQLGGSPPQLRVTQNGVTSTATVGTTIGSWQRITVPVATVSPTPGPTVIEISSPGAATFRVDDVRVRINSAWDIDNFANLGFEGGYRYVEPVPPFPSAPDAWITQNATCVADSTTLRPGAAGGSRSVRATMGGENGGIYKDFSFLRPGDQLAISGWMRSIGVNSGSSFAAMVGDSNNYWAPVGNNQQVIRPCNGQWHQFSMVYTVPSGSPLTRFSVTCWDAAGGQLWVDDISMRVQ